MWFALAYFLMIFIVELLILSPLVAVQAVLSAPKRKWRWGLLLPGGWLLGATVLLSVTTLKAPASSGSDSVVDFLARWFLFNLPVGVMLVVYLIRRLKERMGLKVLAITVMLALLPLPVTLNDGGSTKYYAVLYRIDVWHRIDQTQPSGVFEATDVCAFPFNFVDKEGGFPNDKK